MEHIVQHGWEIKSTNGPFGCMCMFTCIHAQRDNRGRFIIKYVPELQGGHALRFPVLRWKESIPRAHLYIKHLQLPAFHLQKPSTLMISRIYTQKHKYPLEPFHLLYAQLFPSLVCRLPALSGKPNKAAVKALASAYHNVEHLQTQNLNSTLKMQMTQNIQNKMCSWWWQWNLWLSSWKVSMLRQLGFYFVVVSRLSELLVE